MDFKDFANPGTGGMPVDMTQVTDYEKAKSLLCVEVVSTEWNKEMLDKVPHTDVEDMSMVYRVQLGKDEAGLATVLVTNDLLKGYGITPEQLHADAMENSPQIRPPVLVSMQQMMAEMMGMPAEDVPQMMDPPLFVVTTEDKIQGAAAMFYPDFMENAAKELGGSYFVLPSSVHEVLLLPDDGNVKAEELQAMVMQVNQQEVQPKERLADQVYHFDAEAKVFEVGEKFEARQAEKEKLSEKPASVLDELRSKQKEAALKPAKPAPSKSHEASL